MMIVWGSRGREKEVATGTFACPVCRAPRPYRRMRIDRYFTLYFMPLFRTRQLGEYVQCGVCARTFPLEVLADAAPEQPRVTGPAVPCTTCGSALPEGGHFCQQCGAPAQPPSASDQAVRACSSCGGELRPGVRFCPGCGARA